MRSIIRQIFIIAGFLSFPAVAQHSAASQVEPRPFSAWALKPDATGMAYILGPISTSGPDAVVELRFLDFASGDSKVINRYVSDQSMGEPDAMRTFLTWSPDGSQLAYVMPHQRVWRLHTWRHADGSVKVFDREACHDTPGCNGAVAWSRDGRSIYFIGPQATGDKADAARDSSAATTNKVASAPGKAALRLFENGLSAKHDQDDSEDHFAVPPPVDVLVAVTATKAVRTLMSGAAFQQLHLSPDGELLLAVAKKEDERTVRQQYHDGYIVQADTGSSVPGPVPALQRISLLATAWSADSRKLALVGAGALTKGDVLVYDVATRQQSNITPDVLPLEPGEVPFLVPLDARLFTEPNGKFDVRYKVRWSARGDAVFATRRTRLGSEWRTRLWRVSLTGEAVNLTAGSPFDVVSLPLAAEDPGADDSVTAAVRLPDDRIGFARIPLTGAERSASILASVPGRFASGGKVRLDESASAAKVLLTNESATTPEEAFVYDRTQDTIARVTSANGSAVLARPVNVRRVEWEVEGERRFGYVFAPQGTNERSPLIVYVYPREPFEDPMEGQRYVGRRRLFQPSLLDELQAGYVVFKPDIPVVGGGQSCVNVARNIEAALDVISRQQLADVARAAIVGTSFGGWAVGCAIVHTNRFRAAVSVAGIHDLFGMAFSIQRGPGNLGIGGGQVRIGRSVWDAPELFWNESPIFGLRQVSTPLLLVHGDDDRTVPFEQSEAMYSGLMRLNKPVSLAIYPGAGHGTVMSHPDFRPRFTAWLARFIGTPEGDRQRPSVQLPR